MSLDQPARENTMTEPTTIERTEAEREVEQLKQHLRTLYAYARGFVFTEDVPLAQAMPMGQRYAAIAGLLSRLATTGVLDGSEVSQ